MTIRDQLLNTLKTNLQGYKSSYQKVLEEKNNMRMTCAPIRRTSDEVIGREGKPSIFLVTLPKSGTVYIGHTIRFSLDYWHTSTICTPKFPVNLLWPEMMADFERGGMVAATHMQPNEDNLSTFKVSQNRLALHLRDPRAALLSMYYFRRKNHERFLENPKKAPIGIQGSFKHHYKIDYVEYFSKSPEAQMDFMVDTHYQDCVRWLKQWYGVLQNDRELDILVVTHNELKTNQESYFRKIFDFYQLDQPKEIVYVEKTAKTHFRKGDNEEWRSTLTARQLEKVCDLYPSFLDEFGLPR